MKNINIVWFLANNMLKGKLMNANQQKIVTKKMFPSFYEQTSQNKNQKYIFKIYIYFLKYKNAFTLYSYKNQCLIYILNILFQLLFSQ